MKKKNLIILIIVILLAAGGVGYYFYLSRDKALRDKTSSQELEEIEVYPDVSKIEAPPNLAEEIQSDLSSDVEMRVYSSEDSVEKIQNWYRSHLSDKGWEKIWDEMKEGGEFGFMLWKKGEIGFGVGLNVVPNIEGETSILLMTDNFEAWGEVLKTLKEQESGTPSKPVGEESEVGELSKEEKKEEAKKLINEALLKIEKVKSEEDSQKLQLLISEAIEYGKNAVEFDPKNPEILFQMGNIYFEAKEIVSGADVWARYYYEKALELDPNNTVYQEKLREIQSQND